MNNMDIIATFSLGVYLLLVGKRGTAQVYTPYINWGQEDNHLLYEMVGKERLKLQYDK